MTIKPFKRTYHVDGSSPVPPVVFVFGSNLAGRHGAGAAKFAKVFFGALYGQNEGIQGCSYAIPTKDTNFHPIPLEKIKESVDKFLHYAATHPEQLFFVTRIGCGLAGYRDIEIAPMFQHAPMNCNLPSLWSYYLDSADELDDPCQDL